MSNTTVTFTAWLKDQFTGPMDRMRQKSEVAANRIKQSLGKISIESKNTVHSIDSINKELDRLRAIRKVSVDITQIRAANKEMGILEQKKHRLETAGTNMAGGKGMELISKAGLYGAAIAAAYKVGAFVSSSVAEYNVGAQVDAQLAAGIKSTGGIAGKNMGGMKGQAERLQKTTLYDDEATKNAQSIMLTFTKVRDEVFDRSIPLVQDLATKMGTDLNSAALQVGKALNDPIGGVTALRRAGVQLSDQQKEQIALFVKSGQVAKAQAIILKELQVEFGGSAEAAGKAGTGGMTILKNKISDLKENLGEATYKGIAPMADAFSDLVTEATKYTKSNPATELIREKDLFIDLAKSATEDNLSKKQRLEIINQMRSINPDFLNGLDTENLTFKQIKDSLVDVAKEYDKRIRYMETELSIQTQIVDKASEYSSAILKLKTGMSGINAGSFQQDSDKLMLRAKLFNLGISMASAIPGTETMYAPYKKAVEKTKSDLEYFQRVNISLVDINKLLEEAGKKQLFASGDKKFFNYDAELNAKISALEKTFRKLGATDAMVDYYKSFYSNKFGGSGSKGSGSTGAGTGADGLGDQFNNINGDVSKVKNIVININKLTGIESITTNTISENMDSVEDAVKKVLLTAVNDANLID